MKSTPWICLDELIPLCNFNTYLWRNKENNNIYALFYLTSKVPSKICSRQHSKKVFFIFQRKHVDTSCQDSFSSEKKINK